MVDTAKALVCPECGRSMEGLDPEGHALSHFPVYLDPAKSSKLAAKIQKLIQKGGVTPQEYIKLHEEV